jgi:uncharacterized surface protein with fasciclin (FAS1) repeats
LFVPTEAAFGGLNAEQRRNLDDRNQLQKRLNYLILDGRFASANFTSLRFVDGVPALLANEEGKATINAVPILHSDILPMNGIIHTIDTVLFPPLDLHSTAISNSLI